MADLTASAVNLCAFLFYIFLNNLYINIDTDIHASVMNEKKYLKI